MESERATLRATLDDLINEFDLVTRHNGDLVQEIARDESELQRRVAAAKSAVESADAAVRAMRAAAAENERVLAAQRKAQAESAGRAVAERAAAEKKERADALRAELVVLKKDVAELLQQRDAAMAKQMPITRPAQQQQQQQQQSTDAAAAAGQENAPPAHPFITTFTQRLLKLQDGWRGRDAERISGFVREEVRAAFQDVLVARERHSAGARLQRNALLRQHYDERNANFNAFRVKRATVNDEQRQQTLASVALKASESRKNVADGLRQHVVALEKAMEQETSSTHGEMRRTIAAMTDKKRAVLAQEDADAERQVAEVRRRAVEERQQLVERLESETRGLKNRCAALEAGAAVSIAADLSDVFAAHEQQHGGGGSADGPISVATSWFKQRRARIKEDAVRIRGDAEAALGQFRGRLATHARINDGSMGSGKGDGGAGRYERIDELRRDLDQAKSTARDANLRLQQRIEETAARVGAIESSAGVLRADVVAQSAEAEAVRSQWEAELRQRMLRTHDALGSRSAEGAVAEISVALKSRISKARELMAHLRMRRTDALADALAETEDVNAAYERVLIATTKLLDVVPDIASASTRAKLLGEVVEKDAALVQEERAIVAAETAHTKRVKEIAASFGASRSSKYKQQQPQHQQRATDTATTEEGDTTAVFDDESTSQQQQQQQQQRVKTPQNAPVRSTSSAAAAATQPLAASAASVHRQQQAYRAAPRVGGQVPSVRAMQDPFVQQRVATARPQAVAAAAAPDDSFEKLVEFSDASADGSGILGRASGAAGDGVSQYRALYAAAQQRMASAGGYDSAASGRSLTTPTSD